MSKVSIVVPMYNMEKYVLETLNSAVCQTHKDLEVIVVNDASTDNSLGLVRSFASLHPEVKIVDLEKNGHLAHARNAGIAASTGEFVLPLDSDDWIDNQYVEKTLAKMTDGVGIVSTYMQVFENFARLTGHPESDYPIFYPTREQILRGNCLPVCSLIRKEAVLEVGGYPETMTRGSEDWGLWAAIICKTKWRVEIVPEYLFHYRCRLNSMSRTMAPFREALAAIRAHYGIYE